MLVVGLTILIIYHISVNCGGHNLNFRQKFINEDVSKISAEDMALFDRTFTKMSVPPHYYANLLKMTNFKKIKLDSYAKQLKRPTSKTYWNPLFMNKFHDLKTFESDDQFFLVEEINEKLTKLVLNYHHMPNILMSDENLKLAIDIAVYARKEGVDLIEAYAAVAPNLLDPKNNDSGKNENQPNKTDTSKIVQELIDEINELIKYEHSFYNILKRMIGFVSKKYEYIGEVVHKNIKELSDEITMRKLKKDPKYDYLFQDIKHYEDIYDDITEDHWKQLDNTNLDWKIENQHVYSWNVNNIPSDILKFDQPEEFTKTLKTFRKYIILHHLNTPEDKIKSSWTEEEIPNFFKMALTNSSSQANFSSKALVVPDLVSHKLLPFTKFQAYLSSEKNDYISIRKTLLNMDKFYKIAEPEHELYMRQLEKDFDYDDIIHFLSIFDSKVSFSMINEMYKKPTKNEKVVKVKKIDGIREITPEEKIEDDVLTNDLIATNIPDQKFMDLKKIAGSSGKERGFESAVEELNVPFVH